jgi:hypothetical protein
MNCPATFDPLAELEMRASKRFAFLSVPLEEASAAAKLVA